MITLKGALIFWAAGLVVGSIVPIVIVLFVVVAGGLATWATNREIAASRRQRGE